MSERSQRTTIRFGGVRAEVALFKSSGKPTAAKYETRRVAVTPAPEDPRDGHAAAFDAIDALRAAEPIPAGAPVEATADGRVIEHRGSLGLDEVLATSATERAVEAAFERAERGQDPAGTDVDPLGDVPPHILLPPSAAPPVVPSPNAGTTVQQGVTAATGEWIDLTDQLKGVDEATKLEGMEVVATIAVNSIHRERVRDAHYIAAGNTNQQDYKVLALLWHGLRETGRAAVVRWTKRTQQALGIIVARGSMHGTTPDGPHLLLLEVEWQENMRPIPPRALGPVVNGDTTEAEVNAAVELVNAYAAGPAALNELRDERLGKRADLLTLAKEGRLAEYVPPVVPVADVAYDDLAAAFAASAAALR
jgi:hypothetical protein